ncbi:hypothetical protein CRUP_027604 [Coryphaenoides rupestris]|nr:hypothetical protein CRUP_027604 [Coryphaenoides rupestris]
MAHQLELSKWRSAATSVGSSRYFHGDASNTNTYPGRARAVEASPTDGMHPGTPRRQAKQSGCSDNHGIRLPSPEQYLTPLQQKEVCIRHLRARLRDNMERLQHRDCELDDLRGQLFRMQEDWIEEECHRVEAQLALKDARREILHLQDMVESVKTNLGSNGAARDPQEPPAEHMRAHVGAGPPQQQQQQQGPRPAVGRSRSCGCSPAGTLSRVAAGTRLSSEALLGTVPDGVVGGAGFPGVPPTHTQVGQKHLLLEAGLLSEQLGGPCRHAQGGPPAVSCSALYDRLRGGAGAGAGLPISHSCHTLSSGCGPPSPHPRAATSPVGPRPTPVPVPAPDRKPEVRSQACSPTMTWLTEEEDDGDQELSVISPLETHRLFSPSSLPVVPSHGGGGAPGPTDTPLEVTAQPKEPRTPQPQPVLTSRPVERPEATVLQLPEDETEQETEGKGEEPAEEAPPAQLCHWSRYFLVDLLALAMPVVPTVAWLCRRAPRDAWTTVPIGSMLRGCCAVALHSLRRRGVPRCQGPISMNGAKPI